MVHPTALAGKSTHSLLSIAESIRDLIFREYNKDAKTGEISYRDPGLPPFRGKYIGRPTVAIAKLPCIAVAFSSVTYDDAPQNAGSDNEAEVKIYLYGREKRQAEQFKESIQMAECVRHIIIDNPHMNNADGVQQVYQLGYLKTRIDFTEEVFENFQGAKVGVEVAIITALAVYAESSF